MHVVDLVDRRPEHVGLGVEDLGPLLERLRGEDLVEQADELGRVLAAARRRREALVGEPLGVADDAGQRRPVALALLADEPERLAVAGDVVVHRRVAHLLAAADADVGAPAERDGEVEADRVDALAHAARWR